MILLCSVVCGSAGFHCCAGVLVAFLVLAIDSDSFVLILCEIVLLVMLDIALWFVPGRAPRGN
jgi:hypothetical protein